MTTAQGLMAQGFLLGFGIGAGLALFVVVCALWAGFVIWWFGRK